ncbi:MAG TPA: NAD(P)/FAD-dependent oxidoreductase [Solirubrobacteraceae bacterium]|jgi:flavin-dependent dehydrogenase|nr:NAD(P)/FAD-dependent oxidoreductase [Solirubrobacteraceae bacterium]
MPTRATKRGHERTPLDRDCDVLICGASFAGLAVARELAATGADVLIIDRYEIGERQTSACGIPTTWLTALELEEALQQTFGELVLHTPHTTVRYDLPWTFSTFDYRTLCGALAAQGRFEFETAAVQGRSAGADRLASSPDAELGGVLTDRGVIRAPLIVDALGWRRVLGTGANIQPPDALLSRGLEVHPFGGGQDLEVWIDRSYVPAGYGWSFPAGEEVRIGVGSFDPRFHVREPTVRLARDLDADTVRYQGNWIPHALRPATDDGIFFAGDSAGHCLPLTAEGIRTALYFGLACGRELARVIAGEQTRAEALARYHQFSAGHAVPFEWMLRVQRLVPRVAPRLLAPSLRAMGAKRFVDWSFDHYLNVAHPAFAAAGGTAAPAATRTAPAPV